MIYLLTILLIILLLVIYKIYKDYVIEPSFIFTLSFTTVCIMASIYAHKWKLGLNLNTFLVILLGVIEFSIICYITKKILSKVKNKNNEDNDKQLGINTIVIGNGKRIFFLVFTILANIIYLYFVIKAVNGSFDSFLSISNAIGKYNDLSKFSDQFYVVTLPFLISNLKVAIIACGYWFLFIIINNFISSKKINKLDILIVVFCLIMTCLSGSRTDIFYYIVASIIYYLIIKIKKEGIKETINKKFIKWTSIVIIIFLITFIPVANILGRNVQTNIFDYFSIYCGAEVKNLDIFLQEENYIKDNTIWGSQTFFSLVKTIGEKIGFNGYEPYQLDLPFRETNGYGLGNVYTTFYPYIYDFGYIGEFLLVLLMAVISQFSYENTKKTKFSNKSNISILIYGCISCTLILSFFSNKFYEGIFSMNFIKNIIVWYACDLFFCKFKFEKVLNRKKLKESKEDTKNEKINN